jgi:hypothetical protein
LRAQRVHADCIFARPLGKFEVVKYTLNDVADGQYDSWLRKDLSALAQDTMAVRCFGSD